MNNYSFRRIYHGISQHCEGFTAGGTVFAILFLEPKARGYLLKKNQIAGNALQPTLF